MGAAVVTAIAGLPPPNAEADYAIDRDGAVWRVVRDGGIATRADYDGITSAGTTWLAAHRGPLVAFDPAAFRAAALAQDSAP